MKRGNGETGEYLSRDIIRPRLVRTDTSNTAQAAEPAESSDEEATAESGQATVNDSRVNRRAEASTAGEVVTTLSQGDVVKILGDSEEADDSTWVPVQSEDGTEGWVVEDFLDFAE